MFSLFCCVGFWVVTVCGGSLLWVVLNSWLGRSVTIRDAFTSLLITGFSWHGKKKEELTDLDPHRDIVTSLLCKQPLA
jgi:hypothetical protein